MKPPHASREPPVFIPKPVPGAISSNEDVSGVAKNRCRGAGTTGNRKTLLVALPLLLLLLLSPRKLIESEAVWMDEGGGDEDGWTRLAIEILGERRMR